MTAEETQPADTHEVRNGMAASVAGEQVHVADSLVLVAAAGEMKAQDTLILVAAAGSLEGGTVVLTAQAAVLGGVALGVVVALLRRLLGRR
jgi:hypothetical protein